MTSASVEKQQLPRRIPRDVVVVGDVILSLESGMERTTATVHVSKIRFPISEALEQSSSSTSTFLSVSVNCAKVL